MLTITDYGKFEKEGNDYTILGKGNGVFSETIAIGTIEELTERFLKGDFEFNPSFNAILHDAYGEFYDFPYELQSNRSVALAAVNSYGYDYGYLDEEFQMDREFAVDAVYSINEWIGLEDSAMDYIDESFKSDKEFALQLISELSFNHVVANIKDFADEVKNDKEITVKLLEKAATKENYMVLYNSGINHEFFNEGIFDMNKMIGDLFTKVESMTTEEIIDFANKHDIEVVDEEYIMNVTGLEVIDYMRVHKDECVNLEDYISEVKINHVICENYVIYNGHGEFLDFGNGEYGVIHEANGYELGMDEDEVMNDYKVLDFRGTIDEIVQEYLDNKFERDDSFNAVALNCYETFDSLPDDLKADADFMKYALEIYFVDSYLDIAELPEKLFEDKDFVKELISNLYDDTMPDEIEQEVLFENIPRELLVDEAIFDFYINCLQDSFGRDEGVIIANTFKEMGREDLLNDKDFVLPLVKLDGDVVSYISDELRNDFEVMYDAVREDGYALEFASDELRDNKHIVEAAVSRFGGSLCHASDNLKNNEDIVLKAIKVNEIAMKYASDNLRDDVDFVKDAVKINPNAILYASDRIKNNPDLLKENSKSLFNKISQAQSKKDTSINEKSAKNHNKDDLTK